MAYIKQEEEEDRLNAQSSGPITSQSSGKRSSTNNDEEDVNNPAWKMEVSDEELGEKHDDMSNRDSILQLLATCANTNTSKHLIVALQQCISTQDEELIPDIKLERHAAALRELCQHLPASQSLASVVNFSEYHAWAIALTQDLGLGRNDRITDAIQADERALAWNTISVVASDQWKSSILALQGNEADRLLNLLQQAIDGTGPFAHEPVTTTLFRPQALRILLTLSERSHVLPSSLFLKRVQVDHAQPVVGMGRFADIHVGSHDDRLVAVKRLRYLPHNREKFLRKIRREALPWRQLRHSHVLPFLGLDTDSFAPALCMVSPLMRHGHILKYLEGCNPKDVSELSIAKDIADGVHFLHLKGVVHGDLRAVNILVNDQGEIQIADFGLASFLEVELPAMTTETMGHPRWAAPELLNPEEDDIKRSYATDIFSLGRLYLEIFTRKPPFPECKRDAAVSLKVLRGDLPRRPTDEDCPGRQISDDVWALMVLCWARNASARPTAAWVKDKLGGPEGSRDYSVGDFIADITKCRVNPDYDPHIVERLNTLAAFQSPAQVTSYNPRQVSLDIRSEEELAAVNQFLLTLGRDVIASDQSARHQPESPSGHGGYSPQHFFDTASAPDFGASTPNFSPAGFYPQR